MNAIENAIPMEWGDIIALFREYNHIATSSARPLTAYIVYDASNWKKIFHESSRTYAVNSWSNLFFDGKISTSLFGDCSICQSSVSDSIGTTGSVRSAICAPMVCPLTGKN